jgi:asparagine synthase (glutamine-hydrolysing)
MPFAGSGESLVGVLMYFLAYRGAPDAARDWEARCRAAARARGAALHAKTFAMRDGAALLIGWIRRQPVDLDAAIRCAGPRLDADTLTGGGRIAADLDSGAVTLSAATTSPEQIHYAVRDGALLAANDGRLLLRTLGMELDPAAVFAILQCGAIPAPLSIARGVRKVPPGQTVTVDGAGRESTAPHTWRAEGGTIGAAAAEGEIRARLTDALPRPGAGPVTLFFSGGVDSGVLADQLKRSGHRDVTLLNYAFDAGDPESAVAEEMAGHIGFPFVRILPEAHAIEHVLERVGAEYSYPFGDVSTLPTNTMIHAALGRVGRGGQLVEGTGADGIMGLGSNLAIWRRFDAAPGAVKQLGALAYRGLGMWRSGGAVRKVLWVLRTLAQMPLVDAAVLSQNALEGIAYRIPDGERRRIAEAVAQSYAAPVAGHDVAARASLTDLMHTCSGIFAAKSFDPLRAAGLRVTYPFLAPRLAELAALLAPDCVYRDGVDKPVLKAMLRQAVPARLVDRPKHGFEPPMARYLRMPAFRAYLEDAVLSPGNAVLDHVDKAATRRMIDYSGRHAMTNREVHNYLWALTFLTAWVAAQKAA